MVGLSSFCVGLGWCCRWFLFKTPMTKETVIFISMSMIGGFMYSYSKLKEAEAASKPGQQK